MKTIVIIPARLKSTRLPDKVLLDLGGKPLIQRVYENCLLGIESSDIWIATDDDSVRDVCLGFTNQVIVTKKEHESGTDRIAEAASNLNADVIINVQGDEPFFDYSIISRLSKEFESEELQLASVYSDISSKTELMDPNVVKVVLSVLGNALYFSRYGIPYVREDIDFDINLFKRHIGIYAYKKDFLDKFTKFPISGLERLEKLEQLRALENGIAIKMIKIPFFEKGIDTLEDLQNARKRFN